MKTTTLNKIRSHNPCKDSYAVLLKSLKKTKPDDEPLSFRYILDTIGIQDAVWCLRTLQYKEFCLFSADVAETVLHIFQEQYPEDSRPREAIEAIRKFNSGEITQDQLAKSAANAYAAYAASYAAYNTSYDASCATSYADAYSAARASYDASYNASAFNATYNASAFNAAYASANATGANANATAAYANANATAAYANATAAYANAKVKKWKEIETLFLKHFC